MTSPVQVGLIIAHSQSAGREALTELARQVVAGVSAALAPASRRDWAFRVEEPLRLGSDERSHAGDFPGEASLRLVEGAYDLFRAEFWDAGLGMGHATAWVYAALGILAAATYLCFAQRLFLPRVQGRRLPGYLAVANVVIFLSMPLAVIESFVMVALRALAIELRVFAPDLISTRPTPGTREVGFPDLLRIAVFISTVGVTTGALAGGMHRRQALRQIALFQAEV